MEYEKLQKEVVAWRRELHENAEVGFELPKTVAFVKKVLRSLGYQPKECGKSGLVATVGKGKRVFLLRADMDALPVLEEGKLSFACKYGNMHACGHDLHTAMLLGAAKLLKEREGELQGQVKLLFQPAEEILEGAKAMLEGGVLEAPKPQAGLMLHVMTATELPTGSVVVATGNSAPSADFFEIAVQGKGCHGSTPWKGVDALLIAARIVLGLEEISAREIPLSTPAVVSVGSLQAGEAGNVIADRAVIKGTFRTYDEGTRAHIRRRIEEVATGIASAYRAEATTTFAGGCPVLRNDGKLARLAKAYAAELLGKDRAFLMDELGGEARKEGGGSEDFAYIAKELPCVMLALSAGEKGKGYEYPLHHPKAAFDEKALPIGSALYAGIAIKWLAEGEGTK